MSRHPILIAGLLCLAVCLTRLTVLHRSVLDWDESLYAIMAQQWRLGHLPYTSVWDNKPIGIYAIFAAFQMLAPPVLALRLASMACVSVLSVTVWRIALRLTRNQDASLAAGIAIVVASLSNDGLSANTELFMAAFTSLAVLAALQPGRPGLTGFVTGLCLGCAFMIKYVMLFEAAAVLYLLVQRQGAKALFWALLGGALPLAAVMALYAQAGQLGLWYVCSVASNFRRADAPITEGALLYALKIEAQRWGPLFATLPALACSPERRFLLLWLAGAAIGTAGAKSFYDHYFLELLPVLCISLAVLLSQLRRLALPAAAVLLALPAIAAMTALQEAARPDVPREIATALPPGSLYVFDSQPILYILTRNTPPTRYVLPSVLTGTTLPAVAGVNAVAEVTRILAAAPDFIICRNPPPATQTPVYAMLNQALSAHYRLWGHFVGTNVYERD